MSGWLSDRYGARLFAVGGLLLVAATFVGLLLLPVELRLLAFAVLIARSTASAPGCSRRRTPPPIMNSVPADQRGAASGMRGTFFNAGCGAVDRHLLLADGRRPGRGPADDADRRADRAGRAGDVAAQVGQLPPVGSLFAAFLGYNPIATLLGPTGALDTLPADHADDADRKQFFPHLISGPFHDGLVVVFVAAAMMMLIGAAASFLDPPRGHGPRVRGSSASIATARPTGGRGRPAPAGGGLCSCPGRLQGGCGDGDPAAGAGDGEGHWGMTSSDAAGGTLVPAPDDAAALARTWPRGGPVGGRGARAPLHSATWARSASASSAVGGPCRLGDLAVREGVAAPTMTRIVAVLEEAGLVRRTSSPARRPRRRLVLVGTQGWNGPGPGRQ